MDANVCVCMRVHSCRHLRLSPWESVAKPGATHTHSPAEKLELTHRAVSGEMFRNLGKSGIPLKSRDVSSSTK